MHTSDLSQWQHAHVFLGAAHRKNDGATQIKLTLHHEDIAGDPRHHPRDCEPPVF